MAAHIEHDESLDPETRDYNEFVSMAHDFEKIELWAYAITKFKEALAIKPNDDYASEQLQATIRKFKSDNKIILLIVGIGVLIIALSLLV